MAFGQRGTNISMSNIAKYGGPEMFRFPGDWMSKRNQNYADGGTSYAEQLAGVQGYQNFKYGYTYTGSSTTPINQIRWYDTGSHYSVSHGASMQGHMFAENADTGHQYPFFDWRGECHPGKAVAGPGSGSSSHAIIRWKPPRTGTIQMEGMCYDGNLGDTVGGGANDGVNFWIAKVTGDPQYADMTTYPILEYAQTVLNTTAETWTIFEHSTTVTDTDDVWWFLLGPNTTQTHDTTNLSWNIWYTDDPSGGYEDLSLQDMTEKHCRYKVAMPRYYVPYDGSDEEEHGQWYEDDAVFDREVSMGAHRDAFIIPELIKTDEDHDTAAGVSTGNGSLTLKLASPNWADQFPSAGETSEVRLKNVNTTHSSAPWFEKGWTTTTSHEVTFTDMLGGNYGAAMKITKPYEADVGGVPNEAFTYELSDYYMAPPGMVFVERGMGIYS